MQIALEHASYLTPEPFGTQPASSAQANCIGAHRQGAGGAAAGVPLACAWHAEPVKGECHEQNGAGTSEVSQSLHALESSICCAVIEPPAPPQELQQRLAARHRFRPWGGGQFKPALAPTTIEPFVPEATEKGDTRSIPDVHALACFCSVTAPAAAARCPSCV